MSQQRLLVVVGSGPGNGVATASRFASEGFNIALLARTADRLKDDAAKVQKAAGSKDVVVQTFTVDTGDAKALQQTLEKVHKTMGPPEVVLWNAARIAPSTIGDFDPDLLISDFKMMNVGQYIAAAWALPLLAEVAKRPGSHPTFLNSSCGIGYRPFAPMFALCMQKSAQNNFLDSYRQVAGPQGIHVARVDINGAVTEDEPELNPKNIAEQHWKLSQQDKAQWESVVDVSTMEIFAKSTGGGW